jgi:hypothetical protein
MPTLQPIEYKKGMLYAWDSFTYADRNVDASTSISEYVGEIFQQGKEKGYQEAYNTLAAEALKQATSYYNYATEITEIIYKKTENQGIDINQIRANFTFETNIINLLFLINCEDTAKINLLHQIIIETKNEKLKGTEFLCDSIIINLRDGEVDITSLACDYPLIRQKNKPS